MVDLDKNSLQKNFVLNKKLLKQLGYIIKDDLLIKDNIEVTNLEIPANYTYNGKIYEIQKIEANTFSYIKNLNNITIPNTVIEIGNCAFLIVKIYQL